MVKICVVSPYAHLSGHHWPNAVQLAEALENAGCEVRLLTSARPDANCPACATIRCQSVVAWLNPIYKWLDHDRKRTRVLFAFLQNFENAAVMMAALPMVFSGWHLHFIDARHFLLTLYVILFPVRATYLLAGPCLSGADISPSGEQKTPWKKRFVQFLFEWAFRTGRLRFNCETDAVRDNWLVWLPFAQIQTIPVGIQIPEKIATKSEARKALGLPLDQPVFLIFGTHRMDKDYQTVARAAKICPDRPHLLFAGPLISDNDPKLALDQQNFHDATVLNQFVSDEMVDHLFAACDALILPYPADFDRGSVVLLQAAKYLRPVIATNGVLFGSFVPDNEVGILYECGDVEQLAARMSQIRQMLLADAGKLPFEDGLLKTRLKYSWKTIVAEYIAHFQRTGSKG